MSVKQIAKIKRKMVPTQISSRLMPVLSMEVMIMSVRQIAKMKSLFQVDACAIDGGVEKEKGKSEKGYLEGVSL
jgi:hypothetical protein